MKCPRTFAYVIAATAAAGSANPALAGLVLQDAYEWTEQNGETIRPQKNFFADVEYDGTWPAELNENGEWVSDDLSAWVTNTEAPQTNSFNYVTKGTEGRNKFLYPERLPLNFKRYFVFDIGWDESTDPDANLLMYASCISFGKEFEGQEEVAPFEDYFYFSNKQITLNLGTFDASGEFVAGDADAKFVAHHLVHYGIGDTDGEFLSETNFTTETLEESRKHRILMPPGFVFLANSPGLLVLEVSMHDYYGEANAPEPAGLAVLGLAGVALTRRRRKG